ncbi:hypothetical protein COMA2_60153 [Candidatus Nitrospira nitrificans]|uniref:Uncharacterized protein n=1 Tax=Candidatus Nitrospira nitrificans TaxID=1742973 RepID=A0A0S4LQW6_9BACT|nr:hypothetical protein COMA2_60153 [Candidatus Nitrospira nitrificans]
MFHHMPFHILNLVSMIIKMTIRIFSFLLGLFCKHQSSNAAKAA